SHSVTVLRRWSADSGRSNSGVVRARGIAAHCERSSRGVDALVVARAPPGSGDDRPSEFLELHLRAGAQGTAGALSQAPMAGRSLERAADSQAIAPGNCPSCNSAIAMGIPMLVTVQIRL